MFGLVLRAPLPAPLHHFRSSLEMAFNSQHMVNWHLHFSPIQQRLVASVYQSVQPTPHGNMKASSLQDGAKMRCYALAGLCAFGSSVARHSTRARYPRRMRGTHRAGHSVRATRKPTVALFMVGSKVNADWILPILEAVRARGEIIQAVLVLDDWRKGFFDTARMESLGVEMAVPSSVKGGSIKLLNQAVMSATSADVVAICPNSHAQTDNFVLARRRGQSTWSVQKKAEHIRIAEVLQSSLVDEVLEFAPANAPLAKACGKVIMWKKFGKSSILRDREKLAFQPLKDRAALKGVLEKVVDELTNLGYLTEASVMYPWRIQAALAKFAFVNDLASIPVFPNEDAVVHAYQVLKTNQHWKVDPGDLAFILADRKGGQSRAASRDVGPAIANIMAGGGPFMLRTTHDLVQAVLRRTGYLQQEEMVCEEAITLFREVTPHSAIFGASRVFSIWWPIGKQTCTRSSATRRSTNDTDAHLRMSQ